jgi:uncharacterized protein YcbK (DUF882 family)
LRKPVQVFIGRLFRSHFLALSQIICGIRSFELIIGAMMNRRRFLRIAAGLVSAPYAALAAPMVSPGARLRLTDAHSGAVFDNVYRNAAGPIAQAMTELELFLRDRRTGGVTNIDVAVIDFLAAVMAASNQSSATILSAYRSASTNRLLEHTTFGVADNSQHLFGRALDVYFPTRLADAMAAARAMRRGGVGWYPQSHFIHLDVGPVRNWDLGDDGLDDRLTHWPARTPIPPKGSGTVLVEGQGHITVGGGKPMVVASGRTISLPHHRVAGVFRPLPKTQ